VEEIDSIEMHVYTDKEERLYGLRYCLTFEESLLPRRSGVENGIWSKPIRDISWFLLGIP